uniref:Probable beta-glucosidase G n=1 Tax=Paramoeba aestuarina TaxID=180227 RepID=A0A7S4KZM0_9EUKA
MQDGPQGFRTYVPEQVDEVTAWPSSLCTAASFDPELVNQWTSAMADEFMAKGANMILGPALDIGRVPRAGRALESLSGEDPVLGGRMGVEYVRGVQDKGLMACAKHFSAYNQETIRDDYDAIVDVDDLFNLYYRPVRSVINHAQVASVMCSYNLLNGEHTCQNPALLKRDLKLRMNFQGFVVSDWWACHSADAAEAGLDMEMPGDPNGSTGEGPYFTPELLAEHTTNATIDEMAYRIINSLLTVGPPVPFNNTLCSPPNCNDYYLNVSPTTTSHQNLAAEMVSQSTILLKNLDETLPVSSSKKIAVIGSACDAPAPTTKTDPDLTWTNGTYYWIGGSGRVMSTRAKSFLDGMKEVYSEQELLVDLSDDVETSAQTMREADVAFVCGGATASESFDRDNLKLNEASFMRQMGERKGSTKLVGVAFAPGTIVVEEFIDLVDAMLMVFLAGEGTGEGLARVVSGQRNPGGRLPVTILNEKGTKAMIEPCTEVKCEYTEGVGVGYVGVQNDHVRFPFGFGKSYTTFEYASVGNKKDNNNYVDHHHHKPSKATQRADDNTTCVPREGEIYCFYVQVTNTGNVDSHEVVQAYLTYPFPISTPASSSSQKFLKDFHKIFLKAGESQVVRIGLEREVVEIWQEGVGGWLVPGGDYLVSVGPNSQDTPVQESFQVGTTLQ